MLAKVDLGHPKTALRSAVVIGGWGICMPIIVHRAFRNTHGQILKLKVSNIILFKGVLRHYLTLKDEQKVQKSISLTKT